MKLAIAILVLVLCGGCAKVQPPQPKSAKQLGCGGFPSGLGKPVVYPMMFDDHEPPPSKSSLGPVVYKDVFSDPHY